MKWPSLRMVTTRSMKMATPQGWTKEEVKEFLRTVIAMKETDYREKYVGQVRRDHQHEPARPDHHVRGDVEGVGGQEGGEGDGGEGKGVARL